ncbi:uncharacterized protein V6R79_017979 [Siganus canaliculatus]
MKDEFTGRKRDVTFNPQELSLVPPTLKTWSGSGLPDDPVWVWTDDDDDDDEDDEETAPLTEPLSRSLSFAVKGQSSKTLQRAEDLAANLMKLRQKNDQRHGHLNAPRGSAEVKGQAPSSLTLWKHVLNTKRLLIRTMLSPVQVRLTPENKEIPDSSKKYLGPNDEVMTCYNPGVKGQVQCSADARFWLVLNERSLEQRRDCDAG